MGARLSPAVLFAILAAQTCGGLASILTKLALQGLEPWTMVFTRQLIGVSILFAMARARPTTAQKVPFERREVGLLLLASWAGFALPQILLAYGIERSTGTMGALLTPLEPIGIVLMSVLWLGDRLTLGRAIAIGLGTLGAVFVVGQGRINPELGDPVGDMAIAAGHLSWAIYTVASKPLLARHDPMRVSILVVLLSMLPIGAMAWGEPFDFEQAKVGLGWVVLLALLGSAAGTWLWNYGLSHTSASTMATFIFLQPVVGLFAGVVIVGEPVGAMALGGAAVVAAAVMIEARSASSQQADRRRDDTHQQRNDDHPDGADHQPR